MTIKSDLNYTIKNKIILNMKIKLIYFYIKINLVDR